MARKYLGQIRDLGGSTRLYRAEGAFEVDELEGTSGIRRRIFFEDIFLVTYHREVGRMFAVLVGVLCAFFLFALGAAIVDGLRKPAPWGLYLPLIVAGVTAPIFIVYLNRLIRKKDVITIFGRHGRARVEFEWRKAKARRIFQEVCQAARDSRPARRAPQATRDPSLSSEAEPGPGPSLT